MRSALRDEFDQPSTHRDLIGDARLLGSNWAGKLIGRPGGVGLKLFKVDEGGLAREMHPAYDEALLMLDGAIDLAIDDVCVSLRAGDLQVIPAGAWHEILPGGHGSFLLVDPEP
jgi:mannose-6-phosphate isomerase-like protein (cupin superfamily)